MGGAGSDRLRVEGQEFALSTLNVRCLLGVRVEMLSSSGRR